MKKVLKVIYWPAVMWLLISAYMAGVGIYSGYTWQTALVIGSAFGLASIIGVGALLIILGLFVRLHDWIFHGDNDEYLY